MNKTDSLSFLTTKSFIESKETIYLTNVPLDKQEIDQSLLNIENKHRSNPLTWNGQFSPQLVEILINKYASVESTIFDPFAGSGTILYESGRQNISAIASEINPAAYYMASIYKLINTDLQTRRSCTSKIENLIYPICTTLNYKGSLFENTDTVGTELKKNILDLLTTVTDENLLLILKAFIIKLDFHKEGLDINKLSQVWDKLKQLIVNLPFSKQPLSIHNCDARKTLLAKESIDLVITSPPYINVFNYHQQYRISTETLGWDLLQVAKSEIGSNRKHRGNRFLTVIQYCLDIAQVFAHLATVCKKTAKLIFVVGRESRVKGISFFNSDIVSLVATKCLGFSLVMRQERIFKNKFGEYIIEDILHFSPPKQIQENLLIEKARNIASMVLEKRLQNISTDVRSDIESALKNVCEIKPSEIYNPKKAFMTTTN